jgi:hypothetical protein
MTSGKIKGIGCILASILIPALVVGQAGCKKSEETDVAYPENEQPEEPDKKVEEKPYVPVPKVTEYGWLKTANIKLGRQKEIKSIMNKIEDYYSGYASFLKVLALITKDRNVTLKDNPAYLSDVFSKYYELAGADENDPFLATTDYDVGVLKNALYLSWKEQNEFSPVDNYDDMVTSTAYGD